MATPISQFAGLNELLQLQFDQPSMKRKTDYGLKVAKSVFSNPQTGIENFFFNRNKQWKENIEFGQGKLNLTEYDAIMGIKDGNALYPTLKAAEKVAPRYKKSILQGFMNRDEKPSVEATDILSKQLRDFHKLNSLHRLKNKQQIATMEAATGIQHEEGFTPDDEDELEIYYQAEFRLPDEMLFEKSVWEVLENSNYEDLKRQLISDLMDTNYAITKIDQINTPGRSLANSISVRRCKPSRCIYNIFENPVGKDISLIGEAYPISITEARRKFRQVDGKQIDEKTWWTLAKQASTANNLRDTLIWRDQYISSFSRPYDESKIIIYDFEVKAIDTEYSVVSPNSFGKERLSPKKGRPVNVQNGEVLEDRKFNVYCGVWVKDTDTMLKWEVANNIIRPYQNGIDCFFSYSVVSPDADGTLIPSFIERGIAIVKDMILAKLKIRQMIALMEPDSEDIDIAGLEDVDLGTGDFLKPIDLLKIKKQTGKAWWNSQDGSGVSTERDKNSPYSNKPGIGNIAQINSLIQWYNFSLANLNNEWGTNPDALGQPVAPRRTNKVNENQIQQAELNTEYLYDAFAEVINQTCKKVAMLLWDNIVLDAEAYEQMDGVNVQQLMNAEFDVNIDMLPTGEDKQWLDQMIQIALKQKIITLGQATRLRNMENVKDAELYLIRLEKKAAQQAAQAQQQNVQDNAAVQQQSLQSKGQIDAGLINAQAQADSLVTTAKLQQEGYNSIINMVSNVVQDSMKLSKPIPDNIQPLVSYVIQTTLAKGNPQPVQEAPQQEQAEQQQEPQAQEQAEIPQ